MRRAARWDSYAVIAALLVLSLAAWAYVLVAGDGGMGSGLLTGGSGGGAMADDAMGGAITDDAMAMSRTASVTALGLFLSTWTVMMVAMMFPASAPVVLLFDRWRRQRGRSPWQTISFVAGYLVVWAAAGVVVYAAVLATQARVESRTVAAVLAGLTLCAAGLYQLSPLKSVCLSACRSPMTMLVTHARLLGQGVHGPLRVGLWHGAYCLGCCWGLMGVLLMLGLMNVVWMAAVSALILVEKVVPGGRRFGQVAGVGLAATGAAVLAGAATAPF